MTDIPLTGYPDRYSVAPGEQIRFMVSAATAKTFDARLVRLACADPNPEGPGYREEEVAASLAGTHAVRRQEIRSGSYVRVAGRADVAGPGFTLSARIWPTLAGRRQAILSLAAPGGSVELVLTAAGTLALECDAGSGRVAVETAVPLRLRNWYEVSGGYDPAAGKLWLAERSLMKGSLARPGHRAERAADKTLKLTAATVLIAAAGDPEKPRDHYNGKLEAPRIESVDAKGAASLVAAWDFSRGMTTTRAEDTGPSGLHGEAVNLPARAMTGSNWTGAVMDWKTAPEQYGAIHFHDDDLYDCGWEPTLTWQVPEGFRSGIYALHVKAGEDEDWLSFVVRPAAGAARRAPVALVLPSFTYMAYCNFDSPDLDERGRQRVREWDAYPWLPQDHREFGHSTYDLHSDGSGVCYSSRLRPNLNMRPRFIAATDPRGSGIRHLGADTLIAAWLDHLSQDYDVFIDEDLHRDGVAAIAGYRCVITGSHPEYHTEKSLDALQDYVDGGGRLMYLGGDGFYWKIAMHAELPGVIELRRAEGGIRLWAAEPGEYYHSFDGSYGGLWRRNGRPPNLLSGVGFSAQGGFVGTYYRRQPGSFDPRAEFIFRGIPDDALIGDFGYVGGGAAGFEIDRADVALGTPPHALILATSEAHDATYEQVNEERMAVVPMQPQSEIIRSDMLFFETPAGGAVFSVGSITFCGSLAYNRYRNNVAQLVTNVLTRFLAEERFTIAP
jgi:N,N-dimethylformamidase